ncbi:aminotransferase class I/II-fold pyridoxal phosphate-dependent enzyme [Pseudomonas sp. NCHU5208]|uniref:aminotransferase class I/II-fold pyridoxal phosphate-dependent enzyme n=1 Tax=unclassified Pseudomonas TaxID=196821 RepID=UPI003F946913
MNNPSNVRHMADAGAACALQTPLCLNLNESPYGVPAAALQAASQAIAQSSRYQFEQVEALRQALAQRHAVPLDWVSLYPGSNRALHYATLAFTGSDAPLVVAVPGYPVPEQAARLHERPVRRVPLLENGAHDLQAMLSASAGGLIYIANPNNPTGTITAQPALLELLQRAGAQAESPVVLIDEAYLEFSDEPSMVPAISAHPGLIVTRTFSKLHGLAGLRLGYAIAQPALLERIHTQPAHDVPVPAVAAAQACLLDEAECARRKAANAAEREAFCAWLERQGLRYSPSHSNCVLIDCQRPAAQVIATLAADGIRVGRPWPGLEQQLRVTLGTSDEMTRLRQALSQALDLPWS